MPAYLDVGVEAVLVTELQDLSLKFKMLGTRFDHVMRIASNARRDGHPLGSYDANAKIQ